MYHACLITMFYFPEFSNCFHFSSLRKKKKREMCIALPNTSHEPKPYTSNFLSAAPQTCFSFILPVPINGNSVVPVPHAKYFAVNLDSSLFLSYTSNPAKPPVSYTFKSHFKSDYLLSFPVLKSYSTIIFPPNYFVIVPSLVFLPLLPATIYFTYNRVIRSKSQWSPISLGIYLVFTWPQGPMRSFVRFLFSSLLALPFILSTTGALSSFLFLKLLSFSPN